MVGRRGGSRLHAALERYPQIRVQALRAKHDRPAGLATRAGPGNISSEGSQNVARRIWMSPRLSTHIRGFPTESFGGEGGGVFCFYT